MGCLIAAFHLPVIPLTVLVVLFAQPTGRAVPFAAVAVGAGVAVLTATFEARPARRSPPAASPPS